MRERSPIGFAWVLLALAVFASFFELARMDVVSDNEGQRATPPAEMLRSGHFIIPTINGADYLAKPPLLYWAIALVYSLTGHVTPFAARIPTAACYVALVMCVYLMTRREAGEMPARWSALAVLASPYVLERARWASLDIPLTLAVFLAIVAFRAACQTDSGRRATLLSLAAGVAFGAGILLKGPVPFLFIIPAALAQMIVTADDPDTALRYGIRGALTVFALAVVLWASASFARIGFPVPLVLCLALWAVLAWRCGGGQRLRRPLWVLLVTVAVGIALAAPWGLAVLSAKGWPYICNLINDQALTRTYSATRINSASPFYYVLALPIMLAPWGFLLPCQFSKRLWHNGSPLYRFSVLTGWLSVLLFSMIAGKEHEYVLPAAPFILIATGFHLSGIAGCVSGAWHTRWMRTWQRCMPPFLATIALGGAIYVSIFQSDHPRLLAEAWLLGIVALGLGFYGWKHMSGQLACIFAMVLCIIICGMLSRSYHYTGHRSPKTIAVTVGNLLKQGHDVEAVKMTSAFDVYPAFAFYAGTRVPTVTDPTKARDKLEGEEPYFCVLRQKTLEQASPPLAGDLAAPLLGPYTRKNLVLIGNAPLPAGLGLDNE